MEELITLKVYTKAYLIVSTRLRRMNEKKTWGEKPISPCIFKVSLQHQVFRQKRDYNLYNRTILHKMHEWKREKKKKPNNSSLTINCNLIYKFVHFMLLNNKSIRIFNRNRFVEMSFSNILPPDFLSLSLSLSFSLYAYVCAMYIVSWLRERNVWLVVDLQSHYFGYTHCRSFVPRSYAVSLVLSLSLYMYLAFCLSLYF